MKSLVLLNWRDIRNPGAGGAEVHIWEVFSRLVARGWNVHILCAGFMGGNKQELLDGIQVHRLGNELNYAAQLPFAYHSLVKQLPECIVIEFLNKLPLLGPLYVKSPFLCFVHHLFGDAASLELQQPLPFIIKTFERLVPRIYRGVPFLVGSESTANDLEQLGVIPAALSMIEYGVDTTKYVPGQKAQEPLLLYIGRIKRYKQIQHAIQVLPEILKKIPTLQCIIAGEGDYLPKLKELSAALGVSEKVTFLGRVTEQQKLRLFQDAWGAFFLSMKEGFGLTVGEAALCETPTIAYDVPGLRDAVRGEETGILVAPGNTSVLETSMLRLLTDEQLRLQLGTKARQFFLTRSWDNVTDKMEQYLKIF